MITIKLLTAQRDHVARIKIPPFLAPPEVIVWGSRAFYRKAEPFPTDRVPEFTEIGVYVHAGPAEKPAYTEGGPA